MPAFVAKIKTNWMNSIVLKKTRRNKSVMIGFFMVIIVVFMALFAPLIAPYPVDEMDMTQQLLSPSSEHWFGTDQYGRDLLTRVIYGSRVSLMVGVVTVMASMVIGVLLGLIAGFYGGIVDSIIMRIVDVFLSFPVLLLAIALVAVLGPGTSSVIVALCIVQWTNYTRVVRSSVLSLKEEEFIQAARTIGASNMRIIIKYILPNAISPIIVVATMGIGSAIVSEATLSFLGLGVQPPTPSWGYALSFGLKYLRIAPALSIFPGLAIMFTVLGFNLLGDGIRDVIDPKLIIN